MIGKSLTVSGVRLYAPSLNSYNGFKSDAELIVMHTGGGKTLYVCIPIISSEKAGLSAKWFSQIIPFLAGLKKNDNRLYSLFQMLDTFGKEIYYDDFIKIISSAGLLVEKALRGELALPDFNDFSKNVDEMFRKSCPILMKWWWSVYKMLMTYSQNVYEMLTKCFPTVAQILSKYCPYITHRST